MNKNKPNIYKSNLSWEDKKKDIICEHENCYEIGKFRAPKSRNQLNNYYVFCLKHVKKYNKSWNFYKGLTINQIELSMRKDVVWDRPSWPLSGNPSQIFDQMRELLNTDYGFNEKDRDLQSFLKNKLINENLSPKEQKSIAVLGISMPINVVDIKKAYKKLVKKFHPDVNKENLEAEKKFKEINEAYKILLKKFIKKDMKDN